MGACTVTAERISAHKEKGCNTLWPILLSRLTTTSSDEARGFLRGVTGGGRYCLAKRAGMSMGDSTTELEQKESGIFLFYFFDGMGFQ